MLEDFLDWVNEQLARHGLARVLSATISLLGAAGALSVIFGSVVIVAAVGVSIGFAVLVFMVAAIRGETRALKSAGRAYALLQRYCNLVEELSPVQLNVINWEQVVELDTKGNATVVRKITLKPTGGSLHLLRLSLIYYGQLVQSPRLRRGVVAVARQVSGVRTRQKSGARWESSWFWNDEKTHEVLVHFRDPIRQGTTVSVEVEWKWPLYSSDLMGGSYEDFDIRFAHPVKRASHTVLLPVGPNGQLPYVSAYQPNHSVEREGSRCKVNFVVKDCQRNTRYGVRIDRRPGSRG